MTQLAIFRGMNKFSWALLLSLLIAPLAFAQPPEAKKGPGREKSRYQGGYAKRDFELVGGWPSARISSVTLKPDAKVGFNVRLQVVAFDFDVSQLGDRQASPQGHTRAYGYVHLFVNGRKRNRLYGPDFYLKEIDLDPGLNQLEFALGTPQHGYWTAAGKRIAYSCQVTRPAGSGATGKRPPKRPK